MCSSSDNISVYHCLAVTVSFNDVSLFSFLATEYIQATQSLTVSGPVYFFHFMTHIQNLLPSPLLHLLLQILCTAPLFPSNQTVFISPAISSPIARPFRYLHSKTLFRISTSPGTSTNTTNTGFGGLVFSMLASVTRGRGFEPSRSLWIFLVFE